MVYGEVENISRSSTLLGEEPWISNWLDELRPVYETVQRNICISTL
jgi:hypothetical protein